MRSFFDMTITDLMNLCYANKPILAYDVVQIVKAEIDNLSKEEIETLVRKKAELCVASILHRLEGVK